MPHHRSPGLRAGKRTVSFRLTEKTLKLIRQIAAENHRTPSEQIRLWLEDCLSQS